MSDQPPEKQENVIFAVRCTANREDQVLDFLTSHIAKKKLQVYCAFHPHGMRGYIFIETIDLPEAQRSVYQVPYARGVLPNPVSFKEIEHMFDVAKTEMNVVKGDIAEIISGPFKRENVKITRVDKTKQEVIVELLEAAVPIPITVKMDAIKVIRREGENPDQEMGLTED